MEIITQHAKAIAAVLAAVLAVVVPLLATDQPLGIVGWTNIVILAAGAIHVYNASDDLPGWPYAKLIAAAVSTGAVTLLSALADGALDRSEWVQIVIAVLGAFAVYRLPNTPAVATAITGGRHQRAE